MTKEEAKKYLDNYRKMYAELAPDEFLEALDVMLNEPSLPSNVDEAATMYSEGEYNKKDPSALSNRCRACYAPLMYAFKAGAEWMAGQGETHEAEIIESVPYGRTKWQRCVKVWLDNQFQAKGDKVIVQIRKK